MISHVTCGLGFVFVFLILRDPKILNQERFVISMCKLYIKSRAILLKFLSLLVSFSVIRKEDV